MALKVSSVREILLEALQKFPACIKHIEALRPTPLDGLCDDKLHEVLITIAREYPEIGTKADACSIRDNRSVLSFHKQETEAKHAIHEHDWLRPKDRPSGCGLEVSPAGL